MNIKEFLQYVKAPDYTKSPTTENLRKAMGKELTDGVRTIRTFHNIVNASTQDHAEPFIRQYTGEMERQKTAKSYISIEERAKRRARMGRNRRGKNSRKLHKQKRKLVKIKNQIQNTKEEIQCLQDNIKENNDTLIDSSTVLRDKFPPSYDLSSDDDDWITF